MSSCSVDYGVEELDFGPDDFAAAGVLDSIAIPSDFSAVEPLNVDDATTVDRKDFDFDSVSALQVSDQGYGVSTPSSLVAIDEHDTSEQLGDDQLALSIDDQQPQYSSGQTFVSSD